MTVPPKLNLRKDFSCFVRYHREYITFYNFEAIIYTALVADLGVRAPLTKAFEKIVLFTLKR